MRTLTYAVVLIAFVGLSLLGCADKPQSPVAPTDQSATLQEPGSLAKVMITPYTGTDYPVKVLDPGTVKLKAGNWIIQRKVVLCRLETTTPLITGNMVLTFNARFDYYTGEGVAHGSFTVTPDANVQGGVWEGTYHGRSTNTGTPENPEWTTPLKVVAHGKGGAIQAMQYFYDDLVKTWDSPPTFWIATGEGYIKSNRHH